MVVQQELSGGVVRVDHEEGRGNLGDPYGRVVRRIVPRVARAT